MRDPRLPPLCLKHPLHSVPCPLCSAARREQQVLDRCKLPPDGPDVGSDVPGGGAN